MKKFCGILLTIIILFSCTACEIRFGSKDETAEFINNVSENAVRACVKIQVENYNQGFWGERESVTSQGSGVIFSKNDDGRYYVLTNNHVVAKISNYAYQEIRLYDCFGNLYEQKDSGILRIDSSEADDLAIISFYGNEKAELKALALATKVPVIGDTVVAVGSPAGQFNTVTVGRITDKRKVELTVGNNASKVNYPVLCHSANIHHGSSGGMLLNEDLLIVGINYAGASDEKTGEYVESYAIPVDKVRAFVAPETE